MSRKGSFRLGSGGSGRVKVKEEDEEITVVQLGNIDTHRLLLGGERERQLPHAPPSNSLSLSPMKALTALCDTILPSLHDVVSPLHPSHDPLAAFYRTSASLAGTHHLVRTPLISCKPFLFLFLF